MTLPNRAETRIQQMVRRCTVGSHTWAIYISLRSLMDMYDPDTCIQSYVKDSVDRNTMNLRQAAHRHSVSTFDILNNKTQYVTSEQLSVAYSMVSDLWNL